MTREQAEAEMIEGYWDGLDRDSPEPSANRSNSYRHGFLIGRRDRYMAPPAPNLEMAREAAENSIAADIAA